MQKIWVTVLSLQDAIKDQRWRHVAVNGARIDVFGNGPAQTTLVAQPHSPWLRGDGLEKLQREGAFGLFPEHERREAGCQWCQVSFHAFLQLILSKSLLVDDYCSSQLLHLQLKQFLFQSKFNCSIQRIKNPEKINYLATKNFSRCWTFISNLYENEDVLMSANS